MPLVTQLTNGHERTSIQIDPKRHLERKALRSSCWTDGKRKRKPRVREKIEKV